MLVRYHLFGSAPREGSRRLTLVSMIVPFSTVRAGLNAPLLRLASADRPAVPHPAPALVCGFGRQRLTTCTVWQTAPLTAAYRHRQPETAQFSTRSVLSALLSPLEERNHCLLPLVRTLPAGPRAPFFPMPPGPASRIDAVHLRSDLPGTSHAVLPSGASRFLCPVRGTSWNLPSPTPWRGCKCAGELLTNRMEECRPCGQLFPMGRPYFLALR